MEERNRQQKALMRADDVNHRQYIRITEIIV
jgi:hypothetical protein